jgi:uncharacterized repeat protein (TIGR02543 family)
MGNRLFSLESPVVVKAIKTLSATFVLGFLQTVIPVQPAYALPAAPLITTSGPDVSINFGESGTAVLQTTGGSIINMGYQFTVSPQYPGITVTPIDSVTNQVNVAQYIQAGKYVETITATDANGFSNARAYVISVGRADRTLNLQSTTHLLRSGETTTIYPFVDSTTPTVDSRYISSDGVVTYSSGNSTGCTVDSVTGVVSTAFSGGTCLITGTVSQGSYYKSAFATITYAIDSTTTNHEYFSKNDGSGSFSVLTGRIGDTINAPNAPPRDGHAFEGWSLSTLGDSLISPGTSLTIDGDRTYYAIWSDTSSVVATKLVAPPKTNSPKLSAGDPLVLTVVITPSEISANQNTLALPLNDYGSNTLSANIDWGDSSTSTGVQSSGNLEHAYTTPGTYTVSVTGNVPEFGFGDNSESNNWNGDYYHSLSLTYSSLKLISVIDSFGELGTLSFNRLLSGMSGSDTPPSLPNQIPSTISSLNSMLASPNINDSNISGWNVSSVTDMGGLFDGNSLFNQPLSSWNTAAVTNFSRTFENASSFNQDISSWNTGSATDFSYMFAGDTAFNSLVSGWITSNVTTMSHMFYNATAFNQSVNSWTLTALLQTPSMFEGATSYNQPMHNWYSSGISNLQRMFANASALNQATSNLPMSATAPSSAFTDEYLGSEVISVTNLSPAHGSATVDTQVVGSAVTSYTIDFAANSGYFISNIALGTPTGTITGFALGQTSESYAVMNLGTSISVFVNFDILKTVTYAAGIASGTVPTEISHAAGDTFTVASPTGLSKSGYTFTGWSDGTRIYQPGDSYTVTSSNVTLTAQWTSPGYAITSSVNSGGSVTASPPSPVAPGLDQTFTFTPDSTHFVQKLTVDGIDQQIVLNNPTNSVVTYTFPAVSTTHTISGTFAQLVPTVTLTATAASGTASATFTLTTVTH